MLHYSNAKLTATILHQWISEWFSLFIIDSYTAFASFYVEGIAGGNVSSLRYLQKCVVHWVSDSFTRCEVPIILSHVILDL